jgi:selenocysteine lyase/cysteine desulfurase
VVLFCGSGSTGAIIRLVDVLNLRLPADLDAQHGLSAHIPAQDRPVVFIGPYEHHSNELPWRESIADVVTIHEDLHGGIDLDHLEAELVAHADRPLRIGSFSAASNVTGILTDVRAVARLLHAHGALSFFDYAAAAPYVDIDLGRDDRDGDHLDAVFLSPHKMIGGPGTPGVLVARRELFTNTVPVVPGGGTVAYVNPTEHRYLDDIEHREEGGTPDIVGSIRAGLVFALKQAVGVDTIAAREESFIHRAIHAWEANPAIEVLGDHDAPRLSIVSFVVRAPDHLAPGEGAARVGAYLHHNFVVAVLNDLFGIQSRGGCSCAGPYGHRLLGIDLDLSHEFEREITGGCEGIKPGWVRISFNWFISEAVFDYLVRAVDLVATHGWRLLDDYSFDPASGLWHHVDGPVDPPLRLADITWDGRHVLARPASDHVGHGARRRAGRRRTHPVRGCTWRRARAGDQRRLRTPALVPAARLGGLSQRVNDPPQRRGGGASDTVGARSWPGNAQQSTGQASCHGGSVPQVRRGPSAWRSSTSSWMASTNAGWVPTVPARAIGSPRPSATSRASTSRSWMTSMWSLMNPTGTTTTAGHPSACRAARWSPMSGSSHGTCGGPDREQ